MIKLNYTKISKNLVKFFYEGKDGAYGEFYIRFDDLTRAYGHCTLEPKDIDYSLDLIEAFVSMFAADQRRWRKELAEDHVQGDVDEQLRSDAAEMGGEDDEKTF